MHVRAGQILIEENITSNATNGTNATVVEADPTNLPPYGESLEDPPPECDIAEMSNCLGALEAQIASLESTTQSNAETADYFCRNMKQPFQCACKACKLDELGPWDYMYYHSNITDRAKQLLAMMRVDAHCKTLRSIGAQYFPAGHGCNMLYQTVCTDPPMVKKADPRVQLAAPPFDSHFCPRVLSDNAAASRFGVAQTLLDDDAFWTNPVRTCTTAHAWRDELQCKHQYQAGGGRCGRNRAYIVCVCDACEGDVDKAVTGMARWWGCTGSNWTELEEADSECSAWREAECELPLERGYCASINGTAAFQKLQPKVPAPETSYDDDGTSWGTLCRQAVEPMADNPDMLEELLGPGWIKWCKNYILSKGQSWGPQPGAIPNGNMQKGHVRLPVSGLPAPRRDDHDDIAGGNPVTCPGPLCG